MSWTDKLIPASYRGVRFGVLSADKEFGKRIVTHEFPLRDTPFHETLGLSPRAFTVDAFLVGDDVLARTKALEAAIEAKGPGRLVHPYYGAVQVEAIRATTSFTAFEGRVSRVQIAFEEAGTRPGPTGFLNTVATIMNILSSGLPSLVGDVLGILRIDGAPAFVTDGFAADLRSIASSAAVAIGAAGLSSAFAGLGAVVQPLAGRPITPAAALAAVAGFGSNDIETPAQAFALLPGAFRALATIGADAAPAPADVDPRAPVVDALLSIAASAPPVAGGASGGTSTALRRRNQDALSLLVTGSAAMSATAAATGVRWDSRDQLEAYAAATADALDDAGDRAGALGLDPVWTLVGKVGSAWAAHVGAISPPLPAVRSQTPLATVSAALLAYRLDGDALGDLFDRSGAIARRNRVRHPGFLAGGVALEVVGNG